MRRLLLLCDRSKFKRLRKRITMRKFRPRKGTNATRVGGVQRKKRIFEHSIDPQYVKCMVVTTEGTEEEEECLCGDLIS